MQEGWRSCTGGVSLTSHSTTTGSDEVDDLDPTENSLQGTAISVDGGSISRDRYKNSPNQMPLDLFELENSQYSNTIDLYDALPKYTHSDKRRTTDLASAETTRHCRIANVDYKVVIRPAIIKDDKGDNVLIYPGTREDVVESVLRKLAVEGQSRIVSDEVGVTFSLYQVHKELKKRKHGYSIQEIKEAIMVCRGASLECYTADGETVIASSFFPTVALRTRKDWLKNPTGSHCVVVFNPLVTRSIQQLTFRPYNYVVNMSMNSPLARFLHKKMSHNYKQASTDNPYSIMLVSFLKGSERGLSPRMPENVRAMKNALDHLVKHKIIDHYNVEKIVEGQATIDVKYEIFPHADFIRDVIAANRTQKQNNIKALRHSVTGDDRRGK